MGSWGGKAWDAEWCFEWVTNQTWWEEDTVGSDDGVFRLKPRDDKMLNQHTLSTSFFEVLDVGNQAKLTNDVIAMKFLEYIPGAEKLYSDNEKHGRAQGKAMKDDLINHSTLDYHVTNFQL